MCAMLTKLETVQSALEQVSMSRDMARATAEGSRQIKMAGVTSETMDAIMEEAREAVESVDEISRILAEPMGNEADVSEELESMMRSGSEIVLPDVPVQPITIPTITNTERELAMLA